MDPADFPPFPTWAAVMAVALSAVLGFLAGIAPARSASSRDIIRAIRD
jgi:ABC-type antimicrobial peptide transport system permease subunit